jgi:hypothetical protein
MKQDFALYNFYSRNHGKSLGEREQRKRIEAFIEDAWAVLEGRWEEGEEDKENERNRGNFQVENEAFIRNSFKKRISTQAGKSKDLKPLQAGKSNDLKSLYEIHRAARLTAPKQSEKEIPPATQRPFRSPSPSPNPSPSLPSDSTQPGYPNNFHEPLRPFTRPFFLF